MPQVLQAATRLEPGLRLIQAISEFEANLSDDQKALFRGEKTQVPGVNDVMRLTAEIDRSIKGSKRSYGPRWTNFLEGVQKFASIGDVLVGGSQYLPACAAWTVVRFSLLAITNHASYVDQLSTFFMDLGRSAPRYQSMASVWPKSKTLQTCLTEYFIVVAELCLHIFKTNRQGLLKQLTTTMQGPLKSYKSKLEVWANAIRDEMQIYTSRLIKFEAEESRSFRQSSHHFMEISRRYQERYSKDNLLDRISTYDHRTLWKQIRKCGNTTLLNTDTLYSRWLALDNSAILYYTGTLGSGKSVILASMVDDIVLARPDATVAFFFCRHDIASSLKTDIILGSLIRQILEQQLRETEGITDLADQTREWSGRYLTYDDNELSKILDGHMKGKTFIVLDGLDECESRVQRSVVNYLRALQQQYRISICVSLRQQSNIFTDWSEDASITSFKTSVPKQNPDIAFFIDTELEKRLSSGDLVVGDHSLINTVREVLLAGSQGMFLWVVLQISSLCLMQTDHDILAAVHDLPKDLNETYRRLLSHSNIKYPKSFQKQILQWIITAKRPLSKSELGECLSISPGDLEWTSSKIINDLNSTLNCCGGLVGVDEEEETVRIIHPSAQQFVLSADEKGQRWSIDLVSAHSYTASSILTFLNLELFDQQLSISRKSTMDVETMSTHVISSVVEPQGVIGRIALTLIQSRGPRKAERSLSTDAVISIPTEEREYDFRRYAEDYWCEHLSDLPQLSDSLLTLLFRSIDKRKVDLEQKSASGQTPWEMALCQSTSCLVEAFVTAQKTANLLSNTKANSLLVAATTSGSITALNTLFRLCSPDLNKTYINRRTLLHYAALHNQPEAIDFLFNFGDAEPARAINPSSTDIDAQTPLQVAAGENSILALEHLCNHLDSWRNAKQDLDNAMTTAAIKGYIQVLKVLTNAWDKTQLDQRSSNAAICTAVARDNIEAVQLLAPWLIRRENQHSVIESTINTAILYEKPKMIHYLLSLYEEEYQETPGDAQPPLTSAARRGADDMLEMLLHSGRFSINTQNSRDYTRFDGNGKGWTALHAAAREGHTSIVVKLLATKGMDTSLQNEEGQTALDIARKQRHRDIVQAIKDHNMKEQTKVAARRIFTLRGLKKGH